MYSFEDGILRAKAYVYHQEQHLHIFEALERDLLASQDFGSLLDQCAQFAHSDELTRPLEGGKKLERRS